MWQTLITKIGTTLDGVTLVKEYFTTPKNDVTKTPAVFFRPSGFSNSFETNSENMQTFRFLMLIMVSASGSTVENAFKTVLPKVVDAVTDAFDEGWNGGTVEGHRVRIKIDSIDDWNVSAEEKGLVAYAPLNLEIRLLKTV